jgi:hypothetical protein
MEYEVVYIDGHSEKYKITLKNSENHRDALIKVARIASEHGEVEKILKICK